MEAQRPHIKLRPRPFEAYHTFRLSQHKVWAVESEHIFPGQIRRGICGFYNLPQKNGIKFLKFLFRVAGYSVSLELPDQLPTSFTHFVYVFHSTVLPDFVARAYVKLLGSRQSFRPWL